MAFFTPSQSPAVVTREIDLTGIVPNVATSTGAYVGNFRWGPVETPTLVDNESTLVSKFASPSNSTSVDFHTAAYFTKYSSSLMVIRGDGDSGANAYDSDDFTGSNRTSVDIKNLDDFNSQRAALDSDLHGFIAKYHGELGNSIEIQLCPVSPNDSAFNSWSVAVSGEFNSAPGTSSFVSQLGGVDDEIHVAIIDKDGAFTGTKDAVLETYPYVSLASNAKNPDGSTNYIADVINNQSNYVWLVAADNIDSSFYGVNSIGGDAIDETTVYTLAPGNETVKTKVLRNGATPTDLSVANYSSGFDTIDDVDAYTVDFLIAPPLNNSSFADSDNRTIINDMVATAEQTRKDCVVVASPPLEKILSTAPVNDTVSFAQGLTQSNYLFMDNNYLNVFDKYNDKYIRIPANSSTAGLMAQTDYTNAPWFSPAGITRGRYFGVTDILTSPNKAERDTLYKAGINPITNIPGSGIVLYGDKTMQNRPSAFDRINVRRLFLTLERAISEAAKSVLFEFNDEFTRAQFVNIVEPFLREVKGRRGITDFRVVCDTTNNTPEIIDRNEFVATIFIKPARSINYITLNFVATRTGVDFEEVVGLSF